MHQDFTKIAYLKSGNKRQKQAFKDISRLRLFDILSEYTPLLTGTIPIAIDIPESDLDIVCEYKEGFENCLREHFGKQREFEIQQVVSQHTDAVVCRFKTHHFQYEIFAQSLPSTQQFAFRHMLIEYGILQEHGENFRSEVIRLKRLGLKNRAGFCSVVRSKGKPLSGVAPLSNQQHRS